MTTVRPGRPPASGSYSVTQVPYNAVGQLTCMMETLPAVDRVVLFLLLGYRCFSITGCLKACLGVGSPQTAWP